MKYEITESLQISMIILSVALGIAMPKISMVPVGDNLIFAFWFMSIGIFGVISFGMLNCIQNYSEELNTV